MVLRKIIVKLSGWMATMALFLAVESVQNTCLFMAYQPIVPEELKQVTDLQCSKHRNVKEED